MFTPEGVTKKDMKNLLDSYGDELYYFMPVQSGYGKRLVDCYICYRGLFIAVECKKPGGTPKRFQERILDQVLAARGYAICIDNIDALKTCLESFT